MLKSFVLIAIFLSIPAQNFQSALLKSGECESYSLSSPKFTAPNDLLISFSRDVETIGQGEEIKIVMQFSSDFESCSCVVIDEQSSLLHRQHIYAHHSVENELIASCLPHSDYYSAYISSYSPFAIYSYRDIDSFMQRDYALLTQGSIASVEKIFVETAQTLDLASRSDSEHDVSAYPLAQAYTDIGIPTDRPFTGNGINIGSFETGIPDNFSYFNESNYECYAIQTYTSHASLTSTVYGGTQGIAPSANLFFTSAYDYTVVECFDWMISKGVNVINISYGFEEGFYNFFDAYVDYIVSEFKITIVCAAGNNDIGPNIVSPSLGFNAISVASNDVDLRVSWFSCWELEDDAVDIVAKPTIAAPGGNITGIPANPSGFVHGTSISAPMVTGIIALLMEEFEELKYQPQTVMNILTGSAHKLSGQTSIFDIDAGFGLVNYASAREFYVNTSSLAMDEQNTASNQLLFSKEVIVGLGETLRAQSTILFNSPVSGYTAPPNVLGFYEPHPPFNPADILYSKINSRVVNVLTNQVVMTSTRKANFSFLSFTNNTSLISAFRIEFYLDGSRKTFDLENCSLGYRISPENTSIPNFRFFSDPYIDENPFFYWENLPQYRVIDPSKKTSITFKSQTQSVMFTKNMPAFSNSLVLTQIEWEQLLKFSNTGISIDFAYMNSTLNTTYQSFHFNLAKPLSRRHVAQIRPTDYDFAQNYVTSVTDKIITSSIGGIQVSTSRLRAGYINVKGVAASANDDGWFLTLSPRKINAGWAFIEYNFNTLVQDIDIEMARWSWNEGFNSNTRIYLEYRDIFGNYAVAESLDYTLISGDKNEMSSFNFVLPRPTHTFRIYVYTGVSNNADNKGRLCIGNIRVN